MFCICSRHPEVLWAQRSDKVYLTIALPDARDISVKCEGEGSFSFSAVGVQGESFDFSFELFGNIVPEVSALLLISSLYFHSFGIELRNTLWVIVILLESAQLCSSRVVVILFH